MKRLNIRSCQALNLPSCYIVQAPITPLTSCPFPLPFLLLPASAYISLYLHLWRRKHPKLLNTTTSNRSSFPATSAKCHVVTFNRWEAPRTSTTVFTFRGDTKTSNLLLHRIHAQYIRRWFPDKPLFETGRVLGYHVRQLG